MCLAACELVGGKADDALPIASGIEMIHTYSLIHDDLPCMDDDDMRRGKPSSHKVFGEAGAVLAGDALLTHAFEWMLSNGDGSARYFRAALEAARGAGASGMVAGQSLDIAAGEKSAEALRHINALKTGALIRAAVRAGAVLGGASEEELAALTSFAESYGLLFQLTDDIIDARAGETGGYPERLGLDGTIALAEETAEEALKALLPFGERAKYFTALVQKTLGRQS